MGVEGFAVGAGESPGSGWRDLSVLGVLCGFLVVLTRPVLPTPFQLPADTAWTAICCACGFALLALTAERGRRWRLTPFDYALGAYLGCVLATWPSSADRTRTGAAIAQLIPQLAVFFGVRAAARRTSAADRVVVAGLVVGIAVIGWAASDYHLRYGLQFRLAQFPGLEWNGRQGLGTAMAIQFALLFGVWQQTRSKTVEAAALVVALVSVVELVFFYSRDPWVGATAVVIVGLAVAIRRGTALKYLAAAVPLLLVIAVVRNPYLAHLAKTALGFEAGPEGGLPLRLAGWRDALTIIGRHPIAGIGLGNYVAVRQSMDLPQLAMIPVGQPGVVHPHNLFLQQFAEVGIPGGLAYAVLWATALSAGWSASTSRRRAAAPTVAVFYAIVAIAVMNLGENMFLLSVAGERVRFHTLAWLLLGLVVARSEPLRRDESAHSNRRVASVTPTAVRAASIGVVVAAGFAVAAYEAWTFFVRETPAVTVQGQHERAAAEFGRGEPFSQTFAMLGNGLSELGIHLAAARPSTLLVRWDLKRFDPTRPNIVTPVQSAFVTIKRVSGVEWRRIPFTAIDDSDRQGFAVRLQLVDAVLADRDGKGNPRDVALLVSADNVLGGGELFIGGRRQLGSLSVRAYTRTGTAFERFRADVAPRLPFPMTYPAVVVVLIASYQLGLFTMVYTLLTGGSLSAPLTEDISVETGRRELTA